MAVQLNKDTKGQAHQQGQAARSRKHIRLIITILTVGIASLVFQLEEISQSWNSSSFLYERKDAPSSSPSAKLLYREDTRFTIIGNVTLSRDDVKETDAPSSSPSAKLLYQEDTRFTHHVQEIVGIIENTTLSRDDMNETGFWPEKYCAESAHIVVDHPFTAPSQIQCRTPQLQHSMLCRLLKQVFASNTTVLPYNISFGMSWADRDGLSSKCYGNCVFNSAAKGEFTMANFQDIMILNDQRESATGFVYNNTLAWEDRKKIPVFRGHPRLPTRVPAWKTHGCPMNVSDWNHRMKVADFSFFHPDLLDAAVAYRDNKLQHFCYTQNKTYDVDGVNRLFRLGPYSPDKMDLPPSQIPKEKYFTEYQTSVVLGGIGAAFRTARHLSAGSAVVLQDFRFEEWYIKYMKPFVNYIPLKEDLSDLKEVMEWIKENPVEVKKIAEEGYRFYWGYLSFEQTEKHYHELLWRLSLSAHENGSDRLKYGKGRDIWPASREPNLLFERGPDGGWVKIENVTEALGFDEDDAAVRL